MKRELTLTTLLLAALTACSGGGSDAGADSAAIQAAVDSDERTEEMRARDAGRRPGDVLTLVGLAPGDRVIEVGSFGNYYTTLLAAVVGDAGMVYMVDPLASEPFGGEGGRAFQLAHSNSRYQLLDFASGEFPGNVDVAFNVLFYHDLPSMGVDTQTLNEKLYDALKPGGTYLVIDHRAEDGSGWRDSETLHRIDAGVIIEEVTAAGFELERESDLLAHPEDERTANVFSMRGNTDRAVLVFRKPG